MLRPCARTISSSRLRTMRWCFSCICNTKASKPSKPTSPVSRSKAAVYASSKAALSLARTSSSSCRRHNLSRIPMASSLFKRPEASVSQVMNRRLSESRRMARHSRRRRGTASEANTRKSTSPRTATSKQICRKALRSWSVLGTRPRSLQAVSSSTASRVLLSLWSAFLKALRSSSCSRRGLASNSRRRTSRSFRKRCFSRLILVTDSIRRSRCVFSVRRSRNLEGRGGFAQRRSAVDSKGPCSLS
mmetsp:Transcript_21690/g.61471  ORF Transcript_21690/g.61471 Transcript_21690/m.61471 type:complete len:246 (+) Transcript_21690:888-1625(+)